MTDQEALDLVQMMISVEPTLGETLQAIWATMKAKVDRYVPPGPYHGLNASRKREAARRAFMQNVAAGMEPTTAAQEALTSVEVFA